MSGSQSVLKQFPGHSATFAVEAAAEVSAAAAEVARAAQEVANAANQVAATYPLSQNNQAKIKLAVKASSRATKAATRAANAAEVAATAAVVAATASVVAAAVGNVAAADRVIAAADRAKATRAAEEAASDNRIAADDRAEAKAAESRAEAVADVASSDRDVAAAASNRAELAADAAAAAEEIARSDRVKTARAVRKLAKTSFSKDEADTPVKVVDQEREVISAALVRAESAAVEVQTVAKEAAADREVATSASLAAVRSATVAAHDRETAANQRARAANVAERASTNRANAADAARRASEASGRAASAASSVAAEIASIDELTGARRRGAGLLEIEREIDRAHRTGQSLVLVYIDVDGLRQTNNTKGHAAGDAILITLVSVLKEKLRAYDLIVRIGGDEFICVLAVENLQSARDRFEEISEALATHSSPLQISIGIVELQTGETMGEFIGRADLDLLDGRVKRRYTLKKLTKTPPLH